MKDENATATITSDADKTRLITTIIGTCLTSFDTVVNSEEINRFFIAIGEQSVAESDGRTPLPPTMLYGVENERRGQELLRVLGVPASRLVHVEQEFTYHQPVYAGERLDFSAVISDVRTNAAGTFVVQDTTVSVRNEPAVRFRQVLMINGSTG